MSVEIKIERGKAYAVDRGQRRAPAAGLVRGLGIVLNHFVRSYGARSSRQSDITGTFTVEYPEERTALPETYRNMPVLLYDDATGHELCTSCFQCERICPPQVIHITQAKDATTGKAVPAIDDFVIEYDACMSCGLCAEVCPFDAIKMDHEFELATADHPRLTLHREELNRPVSYYASIAPTAWEGAKAGAYKKLQGSLKRRTGLVGIAPQMHGEVTSEVTGDRLQVTGVVPAVPAASAPATSAPAAPSAAHGDALAPAAAAAEASAAPIAPAAAAAGAGMSDEKQARLAAIRAKAAQKDAEATGSGQPATDAEPTATAPVADPAPPPADAQAAQAPVVPAQSPPAGASMSDEKQARLAAIRAKAAQKAAEDATSETE